MSGRMKDGVTMVMVCVVVVMCLRAGVGVAGQVPLSFRFDANATFPEAVGTIYGLNDTSGHGRSTLRVSSVSGIGERTAERAAAPTRVVFGAGRCLEPRGGAWVGDGATYMGKTIVMTIAPSNETVSLGVVYEEGDQDNGLVVSVDSARRVWLGVSFRPSGAVQRFNMSMGRSLDARVAQTVEASYRAVNVTADSVLRYAWNLSLVVGSERWSEIWEPSVGFGSPMITHAGVPALGCMLGGAVGGVGFDDTATVHHYEGALFSFAYWGDGPVSRAAVAAETRRQRRRYLCGDGVVQWGHEICDTALWPVCCSHCDTWHCAVGLAPVDASSVRLERPSLLHAPGLEGTGSRVTHIRVTAVEAASLHLSASPGGAGALTPVAANAVLAAEDVRSAGTSRVVLVPAGGAMELARVDYEISVDNATSFRAIEDSPMAVMPRAVVTPVCADAISRDGAMTESGALVVGYNELTDPLRSLEFVNVRDIRNGNLFFSSGHLPVPPGSMVAMFRALDGFRFAPFEGVSEGSFVLQGSLDALTVQDGNVTVRVTVVSSPPPPFPAPPPPPPPPVADEADGAVDDGTSNLLTDVTSVQFYVLWGLIATAIVVATAVAWRVAGCDTKKKHSSKSKRHRSRVNDIHIQLEEAAMIGPDAHP